jgi:hypothetical protein
VYFLKLNMSSVCKVKSVGIASGSPPENIFTLLPHAGRPPRGIPPRLRPFSRPSPPLRSHQLEQDGGYFTWKDFIVFSLHVHIIQVV